MRRIALCIAAAALAWPAAAAAKGGGAVFDPRFSTLLPGHTQRLHLMFFTVFDPGQPGVVRAKVGTIPLITIGSRRTGRVVSFRGSPVRHSASDFRVLESAVPITVPSSTASEAWDVSVTDDGRVIPIEGQTPVTFAAAKQPSTTQSAGGGTDAWVIVVLGSLTVVAAGAAASLARRRRRSSGLGLRS
jgi:hypothetical protein